MNIEIYSKDQCPYCDMAIRKAQELTDANKASHQVFKLNEDFSREELFEKFPTARTFPQITIDGEGIGGWQEFQNV